MSDLSKERRGNGGNVRSKKVRKKKQIDGKEFIG